MSRTSASKGREILKSKEKFPEFNLIDYDVSLRSNLFYYSTEVDDNKKKKQWTLDYWKNTNKDISIVSKVPDSYFTTAGAVAHMLFVRELPLEIKDSSYLDKKYIELSVKNVQQNEQIEEVNIEKERLKQLQEEKLLNTHIAEFNFAVDSFLNGVIFDAKSYIIRNNVKPAMTKRIADSLKPMLKEIKEAISGKDEQLVEAYSFLTKRKLTKYGEFIQSLISSCEVATAIIKAAKKPRATKIKPPSEIVKNVKWCHSDDISKLKSEHPSKIVNSTEVWLYNTKNRRLYKYVAMDGMKLTVKGITIVNVNTEKSGGKIIRKPETILLGVQTLTSRQLSKLYNDIRGTQSRAVGRLNEDTLIVKCI